MLYKVFLDTNVYERHGFNFCTYDFVELKHLTEKGVVQIMMNSLVYGECITHLEKTISSVASVINKQLKERNLSIFKSIPDYNFVYKFDASKYKHDAISAFDSYLNSCKVEYISCDGIDVEKIISDYFTLKPPFESKKPEEFKDAIIVSSVIKYAVEQLSEDQMVIVVSGDKGFRESVLKNNTSDDLKVFESISQFLSYVNEKDERAKEIIEYLNNDESFIIRMQSEIEDLIRYAEYSIEACPGDTEDFSLDDISNIEYEPYIISLYDGGVAKVEFLVSATVNVEYVFMDENMSYYDREDGRYYWKEYIKRIEEYQIAFYVVLMIDINNEADILEFVEMPDVIALDEEGFIRGEGESYSTL